MANSSFLTFEVILSIIPVSISLAMNARSSERIEDVYVLVVDVYATHLSDICCGPKNEVHDLNRRVDDAVDGLVSGKAFLKNFIQGGNDLLFTFFSIDPTACPSRSCRILPALCPSERPSYRFVQHRVYRARDRILLHERVVSEQLYEYRLCYDLLSQHLDGVIFRYAAVNVRS